MHGYKIRAFETTNHVETSAPMGKYLGMTTTRVMLRIIISFKPLEREDVGQSRTSAEQETFASNAAADAA